MVDKYLKLVVFLIYILFILFNDVVVIYVECIKFVLLFKFGCMYFFNLKDNIGVCICLIWVVIFLFVFKIL